VSAGNQYCVERKVSLHPLGFGPVVQGAHGYSYEREGTYCHFLCRSWKHPKPARFYIGEARIWGQVLALRLRRVETLIEWLTRHLEVHVPVRSGGRLVSTESTSFGWPQSDPLCKLTCPSLPSGFELDHNLPVSGLTSKSAAVICIEALISNSTVALNIGSPTLVYICPVSRQDRNQHIQSETRTAKATPCSYLPGEMVLTLILSLPSSHAILLAS